MKKLLLLAVLIQLNMGLAYGNEFSSEEKGRFYAAEGNAAANRGDYPQALSLLTHAIRENPANPRFFKLRGSVYFALGDYDRALHDFNQRVALEPQESDGYVDRAVTYLAIGDKELAQQEISHALALRPKSPFAWKVQDLINK